MGEVTGEQVSIPGNTADGDAQCCVEAEEKKRIERDMNKHPSMYEGDQTPSLRAAGLM